MSALSSGSRFGIIAKASAESAPATSSFCDCWANTASIDKKEMRVKIKKNRFIMFILTKKSVFLNIICVISLFKQLHEPFRCHELMFQKTEI